MLPPASTQLPCADCASHRASTPPSASIMLTRGDIPFTPPSLMTSAPSLSTEISSGRRKSVHIVM